MASTTSTFHHAQYSTISPTNPANDQAGRTVLITGASQGIGYAIAKGFVDAKASHVILTGNREEALNRAAATLAEGVTTTIIKPYICDINNSASIESLWRRLREDHIDVNILVLNAADSASGPAVPVKSFLPKLRGAFNTNLFANTSMVEHFLGSTADEARAAPKVIINISSFMAHSNPAPYQAAYSTSKAAFAHTLQLLADEIPAEECQIINVHPGAVLTDSAKNAPQEMLDTVAWDEGKMMNVAFQSRLSLLTQIPQLGSPLLLQCGRLPNMGHFYMADLSGQTGTLTS